MLKSLSIRNYALIEELDVDFSEGLTIITGETGAGKSILVGALSLILGERADTRILQDKNKKCIVEGTFDISNYLLEELFEKNDLDYEDITIIRRDINPAGKSRAFINDTPVNLNQLKELGLKLVDIHSQHQTLTLNSAGFQLSVVDAYAQHSGLLDDYKTKYREFKDIECKLNNLLEQKKNADLDYLQFQLDELEEANLQEGEQETLETECKTLSHAEEIKVNLSQATLSLNFGDGSILSQLSGVNNLISQLGTYHPAIEELSERLNSSYIEIKDIAVELENMEEKTSHNPLRIEEINARLDLIYRLQQKHHLQTIEELLQLKDSLSKNLNSIDSLEDDIEKLKAKLAQLRDKLSLLAKNISSNRVGVIPKIERDIRSLLGQMAMSNARLQIEHVYIERFPKSLPAGRQGSKFRKSEPEFDSTGIDKIRFLFMANKGGDYQELSKVASGGELSRLMLGIKSVISQLTSLPTIIFDEIDKGVSGKIADKVGNIMKNMATHPQPLSEGGETQRAGTPSPWPAGRQGLGRAGERLQVITITHLPQIASKADTHFLAYKQSDADSTKSILKKLNQLERIDEIAKLLSGEKLSTAAIDNAKELLRHSSLC